MQQANPLITEALARFDGVVDDIYSWNGHCYSLDVSALKDFFAEELQTAIDKSVEAERSWKDETTNTDTDEQKPQQKEQELDRKSLNSRIYQYLLKFNVELGWSMTDLVGYVEEFVRKELSSQKQQILIGERARFARLVKEMLIEAPNETVTKAELIAILDEAIKESTHEK